MGLLGGIIKKIEDAGKKKKRFHDSENLVN